MKPGPVPSCVCGKCFRCFRGARNRRYYLKNAEAMRARAVANRRTRRAQTNARVSSDEELDRRALEKWNPEWGARA